jgi:hypothetical protein
VREATFGLAVVCEAYVVSGQVSVLHFEFF